MPTPRLRLWSAFLTCAMCLSLLPASALAADRTVAETPPAIASEVAPSPATEPQDAVSSLPLSSDVIEIASADDLAAAVAGQEDGQTWHLAQGIYELTQDHLEQYAHWDAPGQGGWYFPLHADGLTIVGSGQVVITSPVERPNGTWASQDFVSVWGDGVTIDGVDFQSKSEPNKAIEIMGRDFTLKNATLLPVVHPDGTQGEVSSGSIYFNPQNEDADLGTATLENVTLHAYVSASAARAGTVQVRGLTMDATRNIWSVWGSGYGPGLVGNVYGEVTDVTYLVDEGAVLSDILDQSSPYAADTKPGTTVVFAPGTYRLEGPVTIGRDMTLVGAGPEETIFQAAAEPTVLLQVAGGDVDLTLSGIHVAGVSDNSHNNSSGVQAGTNDHPSTGRITIENCRFSNFTKNSVTIKGGTALLTGNDIACKPYPGAAGNGIQIDLGAQAVITDNTIQGYVSYADRWSACGVLVLRDGKITRIQDNTISHCATGIVKETYYDTPDHRTYLDGRAERNNTFIGCSRNVDFEFDLLEAIAASSGETIVLPCDVQLVEALVLSGDVALDGSGYTIYGRQEDPSVTIQVTGGTLRLSRVTLADFGASAVQVPDTAGAEPRVEATEVNVRNFGRSAYSMEAGTLTLTGGTIDCSGAGEGASAIATGGQVSAVLSGLTVTDSRPHGEGVTALALAGRGSISVSGCVIRGVHTGIHGDSSHSDASGALTVDIQDTTLSAGADVLVLTGGAQDAWSAVSIRSGTFSGGIRVAEGTDGDTLSISGGTFTADPTAFVAPGYQVSLSGGMYLVRPEAPEGDTSGPSDDNTTPPVQPPQSSQPETSDGSTTVSTQVTPTVSGTTAKAEVDTDTMDKSVDALLEAAAEHSTAPVLEILVDSGSATHVEVLLPVASLDTLGQHESAVLTVSSGAATVTLDSAAITAVAQQAQGLQVALTVSPVAAGDLNGHQQSAAGDAPVFDLHFTSDGTSIPHFGGGSATVSLPHTLSPGQSAHGVAVYHLDDLGGLTLRDTSYDLQTETVTFTTPHFSRYMVGYRESAGSPFTDVAEADYFHDAVVWAAGQGITLGTTPSTFSPHQALTRAQAVLLLWRAAGSPRPEAAANPFTDLSEDAIWYDAVLWALQQGITTGTTASAFSPNAPCTRAQMVTFLWRWHKATAGARRFADVTAGAYYRDAVEWAAGQGITLGSSPSAFSPNALCTRAQAVTFLFRYMGA